MAVAVKNDFSKVPLVALRNRTRLVLSQYLNGIKIIPSPSGLPRDWRGLAHIASVPCPPTSSPDPTLDVLLAWAKCKPTFCELTEAFKELDRWDVLDDTLQLLESDAAEYLKRLSNGSPVTELPDLYSDLAILTIDDIKSIENGGKPHIYDAFLLYADEDIDFALETIDKLENEHGMTLCTKERLVGGLPSEYDAIMTLIRERCTRLIIIVSPFFLNSPANNFFVNFAQALGIDQRQRKIIPIIYSKFQLPPQICYYFVLDYTRNNRLWDFWSRLSQSIKAPQIINRSLAIEDSPQCDLVKMNKKIIHKNEASKEGVAKGNVFEIREETETSQDPFKAQVEAAEGKNNSFDCLSTQLEQHVRLLEEISPPETEPIMSNSKEFLLTKIITKKLSKLPYMKKKNKKAKKSVPLES